MSAQAVANLFVTLLIAGLVTIVISLFVEPLRHIISRWALPVTAAVAVAATLGSLYFSDVADFVPCKLCWYQRIAMYPLAAVLTMAAIRRERVLLRYGLLLASAGVLVSAYHVFLQWFPEKSNFCEFDNPCSAVWVKAFGVFSIPQMAGLSFVTIIATSLIGMRRTSVAG